MMQPSTSNTFQYGIYFCTEAEAAPQIRMYDDRQTRDADYEQVLRTSKIVHGHEELTVIVAQKVQTEGERMFSFDLMAEQRKQRKEVLV